MKKILFTFIFVLISSYLYSHNFSFFWDFGSCYFEGIIENNNTNMKADIECLDFRIEMNNGFGFAFSPLNYLCIINKPLEENNHITTFGNVSLFYDFFKFQEDVELSPFASFHFLSYEGIEKTRFDFGMMLKFYFPKIWPEEMMRAEEEYHLRGELLSSRIGVRVLNNNTEVFFDVGVNLMVLVMLACNQRE
ncbi:MAG: hypothetical protein IK024_10085 [Treponema sp.]|nr:hypothetical protein [Treponema sp.]